MSNQRRCQAAASGALSGRTTAARGGSGAPPSNTAPANCGSGDGGDRHPILWSDCDSLYISVRGRILGDVERKLDRAKEEAAADDWGRQALAQITVADQRFEVKAHGRGKFQYVLRNEGFYIQLSNRQKSQLPVAYCQVASSCLFSLGLEAAVRLLLEVLDELVEREGDHVSISRCDLYVDACEPFDLDAVARREWVCRARDIQDYGLADKRTGFVFGRGGDLSARVYDKTAEIVRSGKDYLKPLWHQGGWQPDKRVIRVEFQLRNPVLKSLGFNSLQRLIEEPGALWRYCMSEWLRLTVPVEGDQTRSRWPTHPAWEQLTEKAFVGHEVAQRNNVSLSATPKPVVIYSRFVSALSSFMAMENVTDPFAATDLLMWRCADHHDGHYFIRDEGFTDHVKKKAAVKAKQWNLPFGDYQQRAEEEFKKAEASYYQRVKRNQRDKSEDWDQDWDVDIPGLDGDQE